MSQLNKVQRQALLQAIDSDAIWSALIEFFDEQQRMYEKKTTDCMRVIPSDVDSAKQYSGMALAYERIAGDLRAFAERE